MKNILKYIPLLCLISFASCDVARYPLDATPAIKIDKRLEGTWRTREKEDKATYTVTRFNDFNYRVIKTDHSNKVGEKDTFTAFLSVVNTTRFLNVYSKDDSGKLEYMFFELLNVQANKITVAAISDSTLKLLNSAAEVRDRITKNLGNPYYFDDTIRFYRIK